MSERSTSGVPSEPVAAKDSYSENRSFGMLAFLIILALIIGYAKFSADKQSGPNQNQTAPRGPNDKGSPPEKTETNLNLTANKWSPEDLSLLHLELMRVVDKALSDNMLADSAKNIKQ